MISKLMRAACILALGAGSFLGTGCGGDELSDSRIRDIRQSPFLYVAPSASQLLSVNVSSFRQFSVYEDLRKAYLRDEGRASAWNELSRRFGDDPLTKIDQVLFADYASPFERPMKEVVVVISGEWGDDEAFLEAIRMLAAEGILEDPPAFERYTESAIANAYHATAASSLHPGESVTMYVSFPGKGICVFSLSLERFQKTNGAIFETLAAITDDPGWSEHFQRIQLNQPVWAAGWWPNFQWRNYVQKQVETVPELENLWGLVHNHPVRYYGYLSPTPFYLAEFELICESPLDAETFTYDLNRARRVIPRFLNSWFPNAPMKVEEWEEFLAKVEVRRDGEKIFMKAELSDEATRSLVNVTTAEIVATPTPKPVPDPFRRRSEGEEG